MKKKLQSAQGLPQTSRLRACRSTFPSCPPPLQCVCACATQRTMLIKNCQLQESFGKFAGGGVGEWGLLLRVNGPDPQWCNLTYGLQGTDRFTPAEDLAQGDLFIGQVIAYLPLYSQSGPSLRLAGADGRSLAVHGPGAGVSSHILDLSIALSWGCHNRA